MINFDELCPQIEQAIQETYRDFCAVPASILTESDLKCQLYGRLVRLRALRGVRPTRTPDVLGTMVHTEVPWFDENNRLAIIPDITILEPENLSILNLQRAPLDELQRNEAERIQDLLSGEEAYWQRRTRRGVDMHGRRLDRADEQVEDLLQRKGFAHGGKAVVIELKFARDVVTKRMFSDPKRGIRKDFINIQRLLELMEHRGLSDSLYAYMVIFTRDRTIVAESFHEEFYRFVQDHAASGRLKILVNPRRPSPFDRHRQLLER